jgi:hypothetical protein
MLSQIIDSILKFIFHYIGKAMGFYRLKPFESAIMEKFVKDMPNPSAVILKAQMSKLNEFSHWYRNQSIEISRFGLLGYRNLPKDILFPCTELIACPIASLKIRYGARFDYLRVDLFINRGAISEILFEKYPKKLLGTRRPHLNAIVFSDINLLFDPMDPDPFPTKTTNDIGSLPEWVQTLLKSSPTVEMLTPLSDNLRQRIVDYYELEFPKDYLEFVSAVEYLDCEDFEIFGLSKIWIYITPDEYVLKLVEIKGHGALCLLRDREPGLYYIDNEDHIPVPIGNSLKETMCKALNEGVQEWKDNEHLYV